MAREDEGRRWGWVPSFSLSLSLLPEILLEPPSQSPISSPKPLSLYEALPLPGPSPGRVGTLTPGHLDEFRYTEHTRGDKALLEVSCVWNRERTGVSRSVSFLDTLGLTRLCGAGPSVGGHPMHSLQPCSGGWSDGGIPLLSHSWSRCSFLSILSQSLLWGGPRWAPYPALPSFRAPHAAAAEARSGFKYRLSYPLGCDLGHISSLP